MVLIIEDQEVSSVRGDDLFALFPNLREVSVSRLSEGVREVTRWGSIEHDVNCLRQVTREDNCLYVMQREMVVVRPEDGVEVVGSEDATTCHICVLREATSGTTGLAHLDSDDPAQLLALERELRLR